VAERIGVHERRLLRIAKHPIVLLNAAATLLYLLANLLFPRLFFDLRAWREGPIEQVSHLVLGIALAAWIWAVWRQRGAGRALAIGVTTYTLFLLGEEIDWGAIYGVDVGLERLIGLPSFHQSQWRSHYFWEDKLYWIGTPLVLYFLLPSLPGISGPSRRLQPVLPRFEDTVAFCVVLGTFFVVDLFVKKTISTYQCVMYALIAHQGFLAAKPASTVVAST
jgi:hypothetical protein